MSLIPSAFHDIQQETRSLTQLIGGHAITRRVKIVF